MHSDLGNPVIELRPLATSDWEAVHKWARLEEVTRYQAWGPNTAEQTKAFLRQAAEAWAAEPQTWFIYGILLAGAVIGTVELNLRGDGQGEIGYSLDPSLLGPGTRDRRGGADPRDRVHRAPAAPDLRDLRPAQHRVEAVARTARHDP